MPLYLCCSTPRTMNKNYAHQFNGTVEIQRKEVKLQFGKVGIYNPGFIVTSVQNNVGMLLKSENKDKFHIAHKNFTLTENDRRALERELNKIIDTCGVVDPCC
jgi:hypothetical protein